LRIDANQNKGATTPPLSRRSHAGRAGVSGRGMFVTLVLVAVLVGLAWVLYTALKPETAGVGGSIDLFIKVRRLLASMLDLPSLIAAIPVTSLRPGVVSRSRTRFNLGRALWTVTAGRTAAPADRS